MTPQELKNSILQLAIQGKLVEQRPEEGTAEELYRQIQEEKQRLIKEGKIKKEKPLPEIAEDEVPFEVPESWKWVRLLDLCRSIADGDHQPPPQVPHGIPFLVISNVSSGKLDFSATRFVSREYYKGLSFDRVADVGDILFTVTGSYGIPVKVDCNQKFCFQRHIALLKLLTDWDYLYYAMQSPLVKTQCDTVATGTAQKTVGLGELRKMWVPLPPLAEQRRIVAKIEEILPYIDRYEQAWSKLEAFNKSFPVDMQKSILQMAIQGKLVEQRAEEGTGEELYQQIQTEKQRLIKAGTIKKDKRTNYDDPSQDDILFDIPETWKWTRLGNLLLKLTDGTHKTPKYTTSGVKFVSVKDMSNGTLSLDNTKFISEAEHQELFARCNPERGDMLLSKVGTTGVPAIIDTDEQFSLFVSVALLKYSHNCIDEKFFYYLLKSPLVQMQAAENTRGVGNKNWVLDAIANTLVVLPPLAEQRRIVAKLEELLPLCEKLK